MLGLIGGAPLAAGEGGFAGGEDFTGCPLGTGRMVLSESFKLKVIPPLSFKISVSGLKLSTSASKSATLSPWLSQNP